MTAVGAKARSAGEGPPDPVDLEHLSRQTMGNVALEREVLGLFLRQVEAILPGLAAPAADRVSLAHALVGSARGIGAREVADVAARLEQAARADPDAGDAEIVELRRAVAAAGGFIRARLAP